MAYGKHHNLLTIPKNASTRRLEYDSNGDPYLIDINDVVSNQEKANDILRMLLPAAANKENLVIIPQFADLKISLM